MWPRRSSTGSIISALLVTILAMAIVGFLYSDYLHFRNEALRIETQLVAQQEREVIALRVEAVTLRQELAEARAEAALLQQVLTEAQQALTEAQSDISTPTPTVTPRPLPPTPDTSGRLEVTYPLELLVRKADVVTVEIIADPQFAEVGIHPDYATGTISIETTSQDGERGRLEDNVLLSPMMSVELSVNRNIFDISPGQTTNWQTVSPGRSAVWTWSIVATEPGEHKITVNVFREITSGGEKSVGSVRSKTVSVRVLQKPLEQRISDNFINNIATFVIALVGTGGPLGLFLMFLAHRANEANKELKEKLNGLGDKINGLEGVILHVRARTKKTDKSLGEKITALEEQVKGFKNANSSS